MVHVKRYLLALSVLLCAYCGYAVAVAPWIAPPKLARSARPVAPAPAPVSRLPPELAALFPPDSWERQNPTIVETEQCKLLIRDYVTTPDGRLELVPCTLIFQPASKEGAGRPIVLQAPKAELTFDKAFDIAKGEFGRVEKGTLAGEIRIFCPPTQADGSDAFHLQTRAVWLDRQSIRTANNVEFRYGASSGRGRGLEITLLQPTADEARPKGRFRGVHAISLEQLEYLEVAVTASGLMPSAEKANASPASKPLKITCQGEFTFDVTRQLARFQDAVRVEQTVVGALPDTLTCQELLLDLARDHGSPQAATDSSEALAGRLRRIVALGLPASLQSPSRGIRADAAYMEYSLPSKSVHLKADPARQIQTVTLRQFDQHFIAPEMHYELPDSGRLGRLNATGPGELRLLNNRSGQEGLLTARWQRALDIQPQEQHHVVSLRDAASVEMQALGRFSANELHLWVRETGPVPASTGASDPAAGPSGRTSILPDRMLALGNVQMASPGLDMDTGRLEAWFMHLPVEDKPQQQPRGIDHPIREPVVPAAYTAEARPEAAILGARAQPPVLQRFHVSGDVIRTQLAVRGNQFDLEDLSIRGHAQIDELQTPEPRLAPLRVRGDFLELRAGTRPEATAEISGLPAEVAGRGMALAGSKIEMQRASSEVRINGPGEARLPARGGIVPLPGSEQTARGTSVPGGDELHLLWQQGMAFDGLTARFQGEVEVRTASQTARMPALEATLNRRLGFALPTVDMTPMQPPEPIGLARVLLDGQDRGVYIESRGIDEVGELQSRDQVSVKAVVLDQITGALHAQGPGWISTVRRGMPSQPEASARDPNKPDAPARDLPKPDAPARELTSIHVAFEREMVGDLNQRWIEFRQEVRTTYSPAGDFGDVIVADPLTPLGHRMALMRSQTLRITDTSFAQGRSFELKAEGGTTVETRHVFVDAPRVTYASEKESLTIEGDGRVTAKVSSQDRKLEGQRFRYNLRTGELQLDVINGIQFELSREMKLPLGER